MDAQAVLVDVGAGTQTLDPLRSFLNRHECRIAVVTAPADEVIRRQPLLNRKLEEFIATEYTGRRELFSLATVTIDVRGLDADQAAQSIVQQLTQLLPRVYS